MQKLFGGATSLHIIRAQIGGDGERRLDATLPRETGLRGALLSLLP